MDAVTSEAERTADAEASPIVYYHGRRTVETPSSVLISSSQFLNDSRLREWISTETLRRNGADYPLLYGIPSMVDAIEQ